LVIIFIVANGIVYDRFDKNDEHVESYGYDLYVEIRNLIENN